MSTYLIVYLIKIQVLIGIQYKQGYIQIIPYIKGIDVYTQVDK